MAPRIKAREWGRWAVTALLFLGLLSCVFLLIKLIPELQLRLHLSTGLTSMLLLCYVLAVFVSALLWRNLVRVCTAVAVTWSETLVGIAALMLGKYLPGKVVGMTGRLLTISSRTGVVSAGAVTVLEQAYILAGVVMFSAGITLVLPGITMQWSILALVSLALITAFAPCVGVICLRGPKGKARFAGEILDVLVDIDALTSLRFLSLAVVVAALVCAPAWFLPDLLSIDLASDSRHLLVAAYAISIVGGMMAVILPGGIGAREAIFVLMTQSVLTLEVSIASAALLRLINVVADLLIGCVGLLAWRLRHDHLQST